VNGSVSEPDYYHAEVEYSFELPSIERTQPPPAGGGGGGGAPQNPTFDPHPLAMVDEVSYSTSTTQGIATQYYKTDGTLGPLVNSAGDPFDDAQKITAELRYTIKGNRAAFPHMDALAVTGAVNKTAWNGGDPHHWMCTGISGSRKMELVNAKVEIYWNISIELVYKPDSWDLLIQNTGYRVIKNGKKVVATLPSEGHGDDVTYATKPVALNEDGTHRTSGPPDVKAVQVQKAIEFSTYFGTPTPSTSKLHLPGGTHK
jgi:hypothetical protein